VEGDFDKLEIYNNNGDLFNNLKIVDKTIDMSSMIPGVYYLNFISGNEIITKKIVIE